MTTTLIDTKVSKTVHAIVTDQGIQEIRTACGRKVSESMQLAAQSPEPINCKTCLAHRDIYGVPSQATIQGQNASANRAAADHQRAETIATQHTPTRDILAALDSALLKIRQTHPDVPGALAVVIATGKGKVHGHFAPGTWADTEGAHKGSARHEILMSSESLARGAEATLTTLIHEAGHALAHGTGVKDTSRQGRFHNKQFRAIAETMGLTVDTHPSIGVVTTGLTEATKIHYSAELEELARVLVTYRILKEKPKAPKTTVKVGCECETENGNPLTVTVPISWFEQTNLKCKDCGMKLEAV